MNIGYIFSPVVCFEVWGRSRRKARWLFEMSLNQMSDLFSNLWSVPKFEVDGEVEWDDKHDWKQVLSTAGDHGVRYLGRSLPESFLTIFEIFEIVEYFVWLNYACRVIPILNCILLITFIKQNVFFSKCI